MDKKLKAYIKEANEAAEHPNEKALERHKQMLAQFQHERLIHLIVTMFFALFTILFFVLFVFLIFSSPRGFWGDLMINCCGAADLILLIVLICYICHYYKLENGVQKLEELTSSFYK